MHRPIFQIAMNYSRFALQQERKYKIIRPMLPKIHFMNLKTAQHSMEGKMDNQLLNVPATDFSFLPLWINAATSNSNNLAPSEQVIDVNKKINSIQYAGNVEIEDCISIGCLDSINASVMSVFDGHGGTMLSDYCANNINYILDRFISEYRKTQKYLNNQQDLIKDALKQAYRALDQNFYQNVYKEQENLKNKKIKNIGSCGLTAIIYKENIYIANCGDSMAMIVTEKDNHYDFINLHQRLSVNNEKQRERLHKQFPNDPDIVVEASKGCYYLKGRLQPTRTLGDYYMKHKQIWKNKNKRQFNGPYVKSEPDIHVQQIDKNFKYLILGSDGVWDFLSEWEVIGACQKGNESQSILEQVLSKIADMNGKTVKQIKDLDNLYRRDFHDDISVIVAPLNYYH